VRYDAGNVLHNPAHLVPLRISLGRAPGSHLPARVAPGTQRRMFESNGSLLIIPCP
jgi:hypothetical protein